MNKTKWAIDTTHSEIQFKVRHMMITTVTGHFRDFSAEVETEGNDFTKSGIRFRAATISIDTGNEQRDGHLRSNDFFNAEVFPDLLFTATEIKPGDGGEFLMKGDLRIRDTTRSITLKVEAGGIVDDPWGNTKAGFTVEGKINRKDFGLTWNVPVGADGVLVSDEVKIQADVQLVKQP